MNKDEVKRQSYIRMAKVEEKFRHAHVPPDPQAYWLLNFLIAEGFEVFFESYGLLPIDLGGANDGRLEMGWGPLSPFERDVLSLLEERIDQAESSLKPSFP